MKWLAGTIVVLYGFVLIGLAVVIVLKPARARRFLESFASSARAHYLEQALRLVAGGAIVIFSPAMWHPDLFELFGWLIVVTAAGLFLVPWRWHHRFGLWAIPLVIRHLRLYAAGAFSLGVILLYGVSRAL